MEGVKALYRHVRPRFWRRAEPLYSDYDLRRLDFQYCRMYRQHELLHRSLTEEIAKLYGGGRALEVACGTGWNTGNFTGFDYYGLDISEPAVSLALRKHPERRFLNLGIRDMHLLQSGSFDIVYNSSMLEHIGYAEFAIEEMVRLAKRHLFIMFFEGLAETASIDFHPYEANQINGYVKDIYGRKVVLQDHGQPKKGWYWNRYARSDIESLMTKHGLRYEILDRTNRPYIQAQNVLHVML